MATPERLARPKLAQNKSEFEKLLLGIIPFGVNTVTAIMAYYPHAELRSFCNRYERPYSMVTAALRSLRKEGRVTYTNRRWRIK